MKDFSGKPLKEGDMVGYLPPGYRHLIKGMVIGFTPKMIVIQREPTQQTIDYYNDRGMPIQYTIDRREQSYVSKID